MADPEPLKPVTSKGAMVEVFEDEDPIKTQPSHKQLDGEEQQKKDDTPPCSYGKLLSTAEPLDWFLMAAGLIGAMGGGLLLPLFSIIFGDFINAFGNPSAYDFTNTINTLALKFVYLAIAGVFAMYLEVTCFVIAGERQTNRLRARYLAAALRQDIAFFDTAATTGGLLQGLNEDSIAVQQAISEKASNFVHHISTFLSGFLIAFSYGWSMTLVMLGCLPFLGIMGYAIAAFGSVGSKARAAAYAEASTIAQQAIASVRTVAAYNGQAAVIHAYDKALDKPLKEGVKGNVMLGLTLGGVQFIMYCSYAVALFFGAYRIAAGDYTGGQVVLVQIATLMASFALGQASPNLQHFGAGRSAGGRMFKIIERQPDLVDVGSSPAAHQHIANGGSPAAHHAASGSSSLAAPPALGDAEKHKSGLELAVVDPGKGLHMVEAYNGTGELSKVEGHLELRDVWFNYPARPDVAVFRGFTLDVPAGHTVALVGASGSGKSTAVQLIERFYDPMRGSVTLDGVDLRQLSLSWLRQQVGMVSQEPTLFATTIYDNIAIGKPGATKEEVLAAAMAANAHKFIHLLPEGYQTQVGERGVQLSGGQKQRIAIARAILKNPKVLLLDEATSALDTRSERIVQAALDKMVVGRTTVVVAHRLSTIQHAHAIAVVQAGQVVELGRHEELLKNTQGPYSILVQMQKQAAEKKKEEEGGQSDGKTSEEEEEQGVAEDDEDDALAAKGGNNGLAVAPAGSGVPSEAGIAGALNGGRVASVELPGSVAPGGTEVGPNSKMSAAAVRPSLRDALAAAPSGQGSDIDRAVVGPVSLQDAQGRRASGQLHRGSGSAAAPVVVVQDGKGDDANNKGEKKELSDKEREALDVARAKDVPMSRLFELNRPEWPYIIVGSISSFAAGLQHPALAFIFSDMITIFFLTDMDELKRKASFYAWMFFVLACGALITVAIQQACFGYAGTKLATRVRILLLGALLKQEIGFFDLDENSSGRLTSALATDAAYIRGAVGDAIGVALQNISTLAFGYVIALAYNWQMALVVTGTFPVLMLAMVLQMRWATGASSTSEALYAGANQYISEAFSSIRIIHAYNLQQYIAGMYNDMLERTRPVLTKQAHLGGIGMGFSFSTMFLLYAIILWFGGWQVDTGRADLESFLKGFLAILLAAMGMAQAGVAFPDLGKAKGAVGRVFPMLDRQPAINPDDTSATTPKDEVKGEVEFRDIKFTYPSRPSVVIYSNFNLHIPAGKVYALVGESGSGKSTVVSLLERFYDPVEGSVMLDGVDIRQLNLKWLRQQIGLVSQEPVLFAGSVADNIRYGMPEETSLEEVEAAARTANAAEFVARLPEGYNTKVGEGGIQLSGGQKQRIAIARAVLKKPKILLLDEATSALDARSERVVQDALDHVMRGRTCLVIAHRLSTIKNAHAISVLYHGQVIEQGTHAELMLKPNGAYAKLVAAQGHAHGEGGKK